MFVYLHKNYKVEVQVDDVYFDIRSLQSGVAGYDYRVP